MKRYTIDTLYLAEQLQGRIRQYLRDVPEVQTIITAGLQPRELHESAVRICWNVFNQQSKFPWEMWDDEQAIQRWFNGYTLEPIGIDYAGEAKYDSPSMDFFTEVIDPFSIQVRSFLDDHDFRRDWIWEEHKVLEVRPSFIVMENLGDWRIRDWERIQREREKNRENALSGY